MSIDISDLQNNRYISEVTLKKNILELVLPSCGYFVSGLQTKYNDKALIIHLYVFMSVRDALGHATIEIPSEVNKVIIGDVEKCKADFNHGQCAKLIV